MITKEAKERYRIMCFWRQHGLKATEEAFGASRVWQVPQNSDSYSSIGDNGLEYN